MPEAFTFGRQNAQQTPLRWPRQPRALGTQCQHATPKEAPSSRPRALASQAKIKAITLSMNRATACAHHWTRRGRCWRQRPRGRRRRGRRGARTAWCRTASAAAGLTAPHRPCAPANAASLPVSTNVQQQALQCSFHMKPSHLQSMEANGRTLRTRETLWDGTGRPCSSEQLLNASATAEGSGGGHAWNAPARTRRRCHPCQGA